MKYLISLLCVGLFTVSSFAQQTGFVSASVRREIGTLSNSSPMTVRFGDTSSEQVQALFRFDFNVPQFARVTRVDIQFQYVGSNFGGQIFEIDRAWNGASTWSSLTNGLSGSELGVQAAIIPAGVGSTSGTVPALVPVLQRYLDGVEDFEGLVITGPGFNTSGISTGASTYRMNVSYINRIGGDTDEDGDVDFTDFLALAANFGLCGKQWQHGDFTGDGCVQFEDYLILAGNYGT